MRHLKHRHQLGRKKEHRIATMSNLGAALLRHGRIQTTLAKAKALRPFVEKIITMAKKAEKSTPEKALHYRRLAISRIRDKEAVAMLFNEKASFFSERPGGYTRIYKLGTRIGDAAEMAVIQLIPAEDEGYAKKVRKGRPAKAEKAPAAAEEATPVEETPAVEDVEPVSQDSAPETEETADGDKKE
jgi:large subunit ribosomal protein L17